MAQLTRTIDLLPEIFRTEPNRKFLSSTLDQISRNPEFEKVQGFIGRPSAQGFSINDTYVNELSRERNNYQLEPSVVFTDPESGKPSDAITYSGILDSLRNNGANVSKHDRLFTAEYAAWDPFVDLDKINNFNQYYWLPAGPDSVDVSATEIPFSDDFSVERTDSGYELEGQGGENPTIALVRGGSYTFKLNQPGVNFWIQSEPGVDGTLPESRNRTSRDVFGVVNNGSDTGEIKFNVPDRNAQNFFYNLQSSGTVDLLTDIGFDKINNRYLDEFVREFGGIDGIKELSGKSLVITQPAGDTSWKRTSFYDDKNFDTELWDQTAEITNLSKINSVWRISVVTDNSGRGYIQLVSETEIPILNKFSVQFGEKNANKSFYRSAQNEIVEIPLLTAIKDTLYYQDSENPDIFGRIVLVDQEERGLLNISDIIGKKDYTSPNGVRFTNGLKVQFRGLVFPTDYSDQQYYVEGVGTSIQLLPVEDFITPEEFTASEVIRFDQTPFDVGNFEESLDQPLNQDYLVISRNSPDMNPWSRTNRWFHEDVIKETARLNNTVPVVDNNQKAQRPILEFRGGLRLYNFGIRSLSPINVIDFTQDDAFSNVNGSSGYSIDGVTLLDGVRIVFANDSDDRVRNKIYEVSVADPRNDGNPQLLLNEVGDTIEKDDVIVVTSGIQNQGKSFVYDGSIWVPTQQKTRLNQPPLFDVYDSDGVSFGNQARYAGSNFNGSKLFSYAEGTGTPDDVLGFPLTFLTINNVGDIVYNNDFYTDTFSYVQDQIGIETLVKTGFVREYANDGTFQRRIGWQPAVSPIRQRQAFRYAYSTGRNLLLDVPISQNSKVPQIIVVSNSEFIPPSAYTITTDENNTRIRFIDEPESGAIIEVFVLSDEDSQNGFYQIPDNLEKNPLNDEPDTVTLGTIRSHYQSLLQNVPDLTGNINGSNNSRDLGNTIPFGTKIIQHSSSIIPAAAVLRSDRIDFFKAIEYNARAYEAYKTRIIDAVTNRDFGNSSAAAILDSIILGIAAEKSQNSAFFWSDMLPCGLDVVESEFEVTEITEPTFDTINMYDFTKANRQSVLVYVNDEILIKDQDYVVSTDSPTITISSTLNVGDRVVIREYSKTNASFIPNTPTKIGLYPAYKPEKFFDDTFIDGTDVLRGHDGSITVAYGDIRDDVLLEFEKRIYNNLKVTTPPPLLESDVVPGKFRKTEYELSVINEILSTEFLTWSGNNRLDYKQQSYNADNKFTWNYSTANDVIDEEVLTGHWRGIFKDFYDTDSPHTRPWEMLGITIKPDWWEEVYGEAPYTKDNLVLWGDISEGKVRDPAGEYIVNSRIRDGLLDVLPVDSHGNIKSPLDIMVKDYNFQDSRKSWVFGDGAPTEAAWRRSSTYPFVIQKLLALTKPAKFFATAIDRDQYRFEPEFGQYLFDSRSRFDIKNLGRYGKNSVQHSIFNWIVDYEQQIGETDRDYIAECFSNIDVRLSYRMGGFTDKKYFKLFSENFTPDTQNSSLMIPEESYNLLFYKNEPDVTITYSSVIVQVSDEGWTVWGNSSSKPYFEIKESIPNGNFSSLTVNNLSVRYARDFKDNITRVPYGYTFKSRDAVVDFLISYGRDLESRGMVFDTRIDGVVFDWIQMSKEFLTWSQQGWGIGNIINLNPNAEKIVIQRSSGLLEDVSSDPRILLNQNRRPISSNNYTVNRSDDLTEIQILSNELLGFAELNFVNHEQLLVIDNRSIFSDLIYDPSSGNRQNRLVFAGSKTTNWAGRPDAPGFIITNANIKQWKPNSKYAKGEIVRFKGKLWSANQLIEASEEFDQSQWFASDFDDTREGLLPNLATKADNALDFFNKNSANLSDDADLLGLGITGFRPRQYFENLNLDDITQTNLYSSFISSKGTSPSLNLLSGANFGKEKADYEIFENWAVKQGTYGANANRSFFEIALDQSLLQANPSVISIVDNRNSKDVADQTVRLGELYKESRKFNSSKILPQLNRSRPEFDLPTAGYVNPDTVDFQVFSFDDLARRINIREIGLGSTVWVARDNTFDWNVYYVNTILANVIRVEDNLNGLSRITFSSFHGLSAGDNIFINLFSDLVDGYYEIVGVPSLDSITVRFGFEGTQTQQDGRGVVFLLESIRVKQPSDISKLAFSRSLSVGNRVWVDDGGNKNWQVLEKQSPFDIRRNIIPEVLTNDYGTAIAQGFGNSGMIIGAPSAGSNSQGEVFLYAINRGGEYIFSSNLRLGTPETSGFGRSISAGNSSWGVIGSPESNGSRGYAAIIYKDGISDPTFSLTQLLLDPDGDEDDRFGHAVKVSEDGRWIYVSAPGANKVYAYARIDRQTQGLSVTADGVSTEYSFKDKILIDPDNNGDEISVVVNNKILSSITGDYSVNVSSGIISFAGAPSAGSTIVITRKEQISLTFNSVSDGLSSDFNIASLGIIDGTKVSVFVDETEQTLGTDYNIFGQTLSFVSPPTSESVITVFNPVLSQLSGVDDDIDSFSVLRNGVFLRKGIDYTFDNVAKTVEFTSGDSAFLNQSIVVRARSNFRLQGTIEIPQQTKTVVSANKNILILDDVDGIVPQMILSGSGLSSGQYVIEVDSDANSVVLNEEPDSNPSGQIIFSLQNFGSSIDTTTDGRQVSVGCTGNDNTRGQAFVFDRIVERFQVADRDQTQYIPRRESIISSANVVPVKINDKFLLPSLINSSSQNNLGGQYSVLSDSTIEITNASVEIGDFVEIETNEFVKLQTLDSEKLSESANLGFSMSQCLTNCSLYIGAPQESSEVENGGAVERFLNIPRVYGIATSRNTGVDLTAGDTIRINNVDVEVSNVPNHVSGAPHAKDDFRTSGGSIYKAIQNVPPNINIENTEFWQLSSWVEVLVYDINNKGIVNIQASVDPRGSLVINIVNPLVHPEFNKLLVLPGIGSAFYDLGLEPLDHVQTIVPPRQQVSARFGHSVQIDSNSTSLVVGSPGARLVTPSTWASESGLRFDGGTTRFIDTVDDAGVVETFDLLTSAPSTPSNIGQFVFGQQVFVNEISNGDKFGTGIDYTNGRLVVGAPKRNDGSAYSFINSNGEPAWQAIDQQVPEVDSGLIKSVYIYDSEHSRILQYLDWIDPLQGKILGIASENIDYITAYDPAGYNRGDNVTNFSNWREEHVGKIWWDISNYRLLEYHSSDSEYASKRWGNSVSGSRVEVYQWIESSVPPAQYAGSGTPRNISDFTIVQDVFDASVTKTKYYFWVTDTDDIFSLEGKSLGVNAIQQYIESPKSSGVAYIAPMSPNTVGLYNCKEFLNRDKNVLHIEFDRVETQNKVHEEYQLFSENKDDSFISGQIYRKLLDSLSGSDTSGNLVPDVTLPPSELYGVEFRPRQSMFIDREVALNNYLSRVNRILLQSPIAESRDISRLRSEQPIPVFSERKWDKKVETTLELSYQNLEIVPVGYRFLVLNDETIGNLWSIYEVGDNKKLSRVQIQTYKTDRYWQFVDWYADGYSEDTFLDKNVDTKADLAVLGGDEGDLVRVKNAGAGKWEIYLRDEISWVRVAAQSATIQIDLAIASRAIGRFGFGNEVFDAQFFDERPVQETRDIIEAINQDLLIGELGIERNRALVLLFNYILSEQISPEWLRKTSLIDVDHTIRSLDPFRLYQQDNQTFIADYINEVKPYHVKIRQFNLKYQGDEQYFGDVTDFDLPSYWDEDTNRFVSPILDSTGRLSTTSSVGENDELWESGDYREWFNSRFLRLDSVTMIDGGSGYTTPPDVIFVGDATVPATGRARLNSFGGVSRVEILDGGSGYTQTPQVVFVGGFGSGARASAVMSPQGPRSPKITLRYDRYEYTSNVREWQPNVFYAANDLVRYENEVYRVLDINDSSVLLSGEEFILENYERVFAEELSGVDRTTGYYIPSPNSLGNDLSLLIDGVTYPGVQVTSPDFNENTGLDISSFDITPFDNLDEGPENDISVEYISDGSTITYSLGYTDDGLLTTVKDLSVFVNGVEQTLDEDYEVDAISSVSVATVTFNSAPDADDSIRIESTVTRPSYSETILDVSYSSNFDDSYLGTEPPPAYNGLPEDTRKFGTMVKGGGFIDTFSSHAPEELVPGSIFDTINMNVTTRSGFDVSGNGHAWPTAHVNISVGTVSEGRTYDLPSLGTPTTSIVVANITAGITLSPSSYEINWVDNTITLMSGISFGNTIRIDAFGLGGGNQLYSESFVASSITNNSVSVPVMSSEIEQILILIDGEKYVNFDIETLPDATQIEFLSSISENSLVSVFVLGSTQSGFGFSYPVFESFTFDGSNRIFQLPESFSFSNKSHAIVELNGYRLQPPNGIHHVADSSTLEYEISRDDDFINPNQILPTEVTVYINDVEQSINSDYLLNPSDGSSTRTITLVNAPDDGDRISIYVRTFSEYAISSEILRIRSSVDIKEGDVVTIRTWGDTREQRLQTQVFQGPVGVMSSDVIPWDSRPYDTDRYDEVGESADFVTEYSLGTSGLSPSRLWVTYNGERLLSNLDYVIEDRNGEDVLIVTKVNVASDDVVAVTMFGQNIVPSPLKFKIFEDMRGGQSLFRIINSTTTTLSQPLEISDTVIHLQDASVLKESALSQGRFGVLFVGGERITFRNIDYNNNTVSGLRRGTAGTAVLFHDLGSEVTDGTRSNEFPDAFSQTWYDLGDTTILTGNSLQRATNKIAQFLKGS